MVGFFENIGWLTNLITILLFIIFVVGKVWVIIRDRSLYDEIYECVQVDENAEFNRQFILDKDGQEVIAISSPKGIYDIKIYKITTRNSQSGEIQSKEEIPANMEDNIRHPIMLNKNEKVYIRTDLPCGVPKFQLEIIRYDYVKVQVELGHNGKVGGVSLVNQKTKPSVKRWMYYLCQ